MADVEGARMADVHRFAQTSREINYDNALMRFKLQQEVAAYYLAEVLGHVEVTHRQLAKATANHCPDGNWLMYLDDGDYSVN